MASKVDLSSAPQASSSSVQSPISKLDERIANLKKWIAPQKELANKLMSQFGVQSYEEITAEEGSQDPLSGKLPRSFFEGLRKQEAELEELEKIRTIAPNLRRSSEDFQKSLKTAIRPTKIDPQYFDQTFDRINLSFEGNKISGPEAFTEALIKNGVSKGSIPVIKHLCSSKALTPIYTLLSQHMEKVAGGILRNSAYKQPESAVSLTITRPENYVQITATTKAVFDQILSKDPEKDPENLPEPITFNAKIIYTIDDDGEVSTQVNTDFQFPVFDRLTFEPKTKMNAESKEEDEDNTLVRSSRFSV